MSPMQEYERQKRAEAKRQLSEGVTLMTLGVVETVQSELRSAVALGVVGAIWGLGVTVALGGNAKEHVVSSVKKAARWGAIYGWYNASSQYNALAKEVKLPQVGWVDHVVAGLAAHRALDHKSPFASMDREASILMTQLLNPITLRGAREVGQSLVTAVRP